MRSNDLLPWVAIAQPWTQPFADAGLQSLFGGYPSPVTATTLTQLMKWLKIVKTWNFSANMAGDYLDEFDVVQSTTSERSIELPDGSLRGYTNSDGGGYTHFRFPYNNEKQKLIPITENPFFFPDQYLGTGYNSIFNLVSGDNVPLAVQMLKIRIGPVGSPDPATYSVFAEIRPGSGDLGIFWFCTDPAVFVAAGVSYALSLSVLMFDGIEVPLYQTTSGLQSTWSGDFVIDPGTYWPYARNDGSFAIWDETGGAQLIFPGDPEFYFWEP